MTDIFRDFFIASHAAFDTLTNYRYLAPSLAAGFIIASFHINYHYQRMADEEVLRRRR